MLHRAAAFASVVSGGIYAYCMGKWLFNWARDVASNKNKQKGYLEAPPTGRRRAEHAASGERAGGKAADGGSREEDCLRTTIGSNFGHSNNNA